MFAHWRRFVWAVCSLALVLALVGIKPQALTHARPQLAATRKLSAITAADGTLQQLKVVGDRALYLADYDLRERFDLYSAPLAGGPPARLTAGLPGATVEQFEGAAGGLVVFSLQQREPLPGRRFLYSVPAAGGTPTLLGPRYPSPEPIHPGGSQLSFAVTPDGSRVVYMVDVAARGFHELFSVSTAGGSPVRLSPALPDPLPPSFGPWVSDFALSPDGQRAVFRMADRLDGASTLYVVPTTGAVAPQPLASGTFGPLLAISPDSSRVAYSLAVDYASSQLRSVPLAGGASAELAAGVFARVAFTPDSQLLVFRGQLAGGTAQVIAGVPAAGGQPPTPIASSDLGFGSAELSFVFAPDGASVFYTVAPDMHLRRAPVAGGAGAVVHDTSGVDLSTLRFTADGRYAVFMEWYGLGRAFSYPLAGGPSRLLGASLSSPPLPMPAGENVVFSTRIFTPSAPPQVTDVLYGVSAAEGQARVLTSTLGLGQRMLLAQATAPGDLAILSAGAGSGAGPRWRELFAVPFAGAAPRLLDRARALAGAVSAFAVSPADDRTVYLADQETDEVFNLYSAPIAGGPPVMLNRPGQQVFTYTLSPAGGHLFYSAYENGRSRLYSAPIAQGPGTPVGTPGFSAPSTIKFTPDGSQLVVVRDDGLYRIPQAGGAPELIDSGVNSFSAPPILFTPDSARVIYKAGFSVRSAPLDGGPVTIVGQGYEPALAPDGARLVYQRMRESDNWPGDLVAVPVQGGAAVTLLPAPGHVRVVGFTPDSARVVVVTTTPGGEGGAEVERLRSVPLGGGPALTLAETAPGSPLFFTSRIVAAVAPGGERVVYRLLEQKDAGTVHAELRSVPVGGGPTALHFGTDGDQMTSIPFTISPDGATLLFAGGGALRRGPAAGGHATTLSAGGTVGQFAFTEDGAAVFVEGGGVFRAPPDGPTARVDDLPATTAAAQFALSGRSVVFTGATAPAPGSVGQGPVELYAADIPLMLPEAGFLQPSLGVAESAGVVPIEVRLSRAASVPIAAGYRVVGGTAVAGVDYDLAPGPLTFRPGATRATIPLTLHNRPGLNGTRTVEIALDAPGLAGAGAAGTTITVTVSDDERGVFLPLLRR